MTDTFDRTQLDGKDRDQLSEIAVGARREVGQPHAQGRARRRDRRRAAARLERRRRRLDGRRTRPRKIRSTASGGDDLASLADEENALARRERAGRRHGAHPAPRRPRRPTATATRTRDSTPTRPPTRDLDDRPIRPRRRADATDDDTGVRRRLRPSDGGGRPVAAASSSARDDDGQGNRSAGAGAVVATATARAPAAASPVGASAPSAASRASRGDDFSGELIELEGLLDLRDEGYGFLRTSGYLAGRNDAYVSASQVRRFGLRKGDYVKGATRPPASSEKYPALVRVDLINGMTPDEARTACASRTSRRCSPTRGSGSSSTTTRARSPAASSTSSRRSGRVSAA